MEVVPVSVATASRAWDEQHLDLSAAARQIGGASSGGFTANVSGTASRFTSAWQRFATSLGNDSETRADALRTTIRDYVETDDALGEDYFALVRALGEER